jgi:hypothetical protein
MTKEGQYSIKPNNIEGNPMKAFYFATQDRKLRYGDDRPIVVGETHTVDCKPIPCEQGLHASKRLIDALRYAPGGVLYLVELSGEIVETDDKACATERKYLAEFDLSNVLFKFSCACALVNIELIKPYTKDFDFILEFLKNPVKENAAYAAEAADAAARAAAYAADAAYAAAYAAEAAYAADAAAYAADAARASAYAADAAYAAAYAAEAAYAAADAARASADAAADAAAYAAYAAARAARENQNAMFTQMVRDATGWDI